MGLFDGFPFTSKEERERRKKDFDNRVVPFGAEEQRDKVRETLKVLFPKVDLLDATFAFFNAKDAYTLKDTEEEGLAAARLKLSKIRWIDGRTMTILLRYVQLETKATSLEDYPTPEDILSGLFEEDE